ncbi:uncharacterized protein BX664DRAFT_296103 [Halteromyces radiatus]|uniref:uncharacterized protein n=1 Tax=Halteromyces radiatus TaxID=101107 RepID=UPI0022204A9C|nr:uncharacterized protein BX664DRAFT_296103 [Halteromyces radiatus]KAI8088767.1 hypothetical protein BX664DRAFT_296103 [Halteromyces radiatus]
MVTLQKIIHRVTETRWSKCYVGVAVLQCIFVVILQSVICSLNDTEARLLPTPPSEGLLTGSIPETEIPMMAADRLGRIKWENICFIGFEIWFVVMAIDATVYQNTAEILALANINIICAVLGALEVVDGNKWLTKLSNTRFSIEPLDLAEKLEIALSVVILIFACVMAYLSYQMSRQFGWNIYKKLGAQLSIQKMYRVFQFFVLSLKIDVFTQFLVSIFYVIQYAIKQGIQWETGIQIAITILMLPMFYFARTAGSNESYGRMIIFITFEAIVIVHYVLILLQTMGPYNSWYVWICLVWLGVVMDISTVVLGCLCMRNFERGLQPYVQRGAANKNKHELTIQKSQSRLSWRIDED